MTIREWSAWDRRSLSSAAGEVDVWLLDTSQCSRIPETKFECFAEWEIARWARFIFASEANRFAASQLHLRAVLSRYIGGDPLNIRLRGFSPGQLVLLR